MATLLRQVGKYGSYWAFLAVWCEQSGETMLPIPKFQHLLRVEARQTGKRSGRPGQCSADHALFPARKALARDAVSTERRQGRRSGEENSMREMNLLSNRAAALMGRGSCQSAEIFVGTPELLVDKWG